MMSLFVLTLLACSPPDTGAPTKPDGSDTAVAPDSHTGDSDTAAIDSDSGETGDSGDSDTQVDSDTDTRPELVECDRALGWRYVALGYMQTCGIHTDGCAECWGRGEAQGADDRDTGVYHWNGEDRPPAGDYASISMVGTPLPYFDTPNACGILTDGTLICWGSNILGTTETPPGAYLTSITASSYAAAIDTTNRVVVWGYAAVAPDGEFTDIAAGHQVILLALDGSIVATYMDGETEEAPAGTFIDVSIGIEAACALKDDGSVLCWDEFDPGNAEFDALTLTAPDGPFVDVCVLGGSQACALDAAGTASCWEISGGFDAPADETFTQLGCGAGHACGVTPDNRIVCWGSDAYGETIPPT